MLGDAGYSLRRRRKLDDSCKHPKNRLALSFNWQGPDANAATAQRRELTPDDEIPDKRKKLRRKRRINIIPTGVHEGYVGGGTIRRLDRQPQTVGELAAMFPNASVLSKAKADTALVPVGGKRIQEQNTDIGAIHGTHARLPIEVAMWSTIDQTGVATQIAIEITIEASNESPEWLARLTDGIRKQFAGEFHDRKTRLGLIYAQ